MPDTRAPHPVQPIELDTHGVAHFRPNALVRAIVELAHLDLAKLFASDRFMRDDREQLAELLGYTLIDFGELPCTSSEVYATACAMLDAIERHDALAATDPSATSATAPASLTSTTTQPYAPEERDGQHLE